MYRFARLANGVAAMLFAGGVFASVASEAAPPPPPAEAFAGAPGIQFAAIAPNGKQLARDEIRDGQVRVVIWNADTSATVRVVNIDAPSKLRGLEWADDETLLVDVSVQKAMACSASKSCSYEWERTLAIPMDGSAPRMLLLDDTDRQWATGALRLASHPARPHSVTMAAWDYLATRQKQEIGTRLAGSDRDRSGWTSVVFDVDTRTGKGRPLATGTGYTKQWIVDRAGDPIARSEWVAAHSAYSIVVRQGAGWREVFSQSGKGLLDLAGITLDGKAIVAFGAIDSDRSKAWSIPLDGSPMTVLYEDPDADVDEAVLDSYRNAVVGVRTGGLEPKIHWLDPAVAAQLRSLASAFSGKTVKVLDHSADGQRVLVDVDTKSRPPTIHLVDFDKSRADVIGEVYPALTRAAFGEVRRIHYLARDGVGIPAYLTLPPGTNGKDLPLVVLPHGGPESRDGDGFDYVAQFLATRGYAVLQPQFRGSTGFGDAFRRAGYRQWGGLMQDDVSDGVRHLIADGTANPHQICIVGFSYGGYAALAGATFTPDLYACAASIAGVSDLPAMLLTTRRSYGKESDSIAYWNEHIGLGSDPNVIAKSPVRSAATVNAPVLLMHGVEDSVVPIDQSERMAKALQSAGKPVTFIRLAGEDHWLSRSETRLQVLKELEKFLASHLH